ncbi:MAG: 50S ribosomal protein L25 [Patescibacteria group bacterium]
MQTLNVTARDMEVAPDTLREEGKVPAVFYGPKEASTPVTLNRKEFEKVWRAAGETTVVVLQGIDEDKDVLIHEVDVHPVTDIVQHVDFYAVEKGKKVKTHVPLEFIGESAAVKNLGGTLMKVVHEIEVEALPKDLPHTIKIDISSLETFQSHISIKDIGAVHGVEIIGNPDDTIVSVTEPKEEEVEVPVEAIDMDAIEVEKKGKKEEEGEGEASAPEETPAA